MSHADVICELTGKWNTGDIEGVPDLYTQDAEIRTGPHWIEVDSLDEFGDMFTFRDGKIAVLEWFADHDTAVAAARGT